MASKPSAQQGLTLVELLVAMAIMALIMTMLFGGLHLSSRTWDAVDRRIDQTEERRLVSNFLRRTFERMRIVHRAPEGEEERLLFSGRGDAIEFVAAMPPGVGLRGYYLVRLFFERLRDSSRLILQYWLLHPDILAGSGDIPRWTPLAEDYALAFGTDAADSSVASHLYGERILLEGMDELHFGYAESTETEVSDWQESWTNLEEAAGFVKLDMKFPEGPWPELVFAMGVDEGRSVVGFGGG